MSTPSGIYEILNAENGKRYIGSATRLAKRFAVHRHGLRRGVHHSLKLQRAWDKHGEASFAFRVLLVCAPEDLIMYEQRCIDIFRPEYNILPTAGSCLGVKHSAEARKRMSEGGKGKVLTPEHRAKISVAQKGKSVSPETRARMSEASIGNTKLLGRRLTVEHRTNIAKGNIGKKLSPETRAKLSAARVGKKIGPQSPEHRAKIAAANKGRKWTPELRQKLVGRPCSLETRAKISAAQIVRLSKKEKTK